MFNINLLPEKEKQNVAWGKRTTQMAYLGSLLIAAILIFVILLFPSYIFLALQNNDIVRNLELEKKSQEAIRIPAIANKIATINAETDRIAQSRTQSFALGDFVERFNRLAENRVLLTHIRYRQTNGAVLISGWAETRNKFLDFKSALEADGFVRNIISPINNIIKETDVQFSLTGTLSHQ